MVRHLTHRSARQGCWKIGNRQLGYLCTQATKATIKALPPSYFNPTEAVSLFPISTNVISEKHHPTRKKVTIIIEKPVYPCYRPAFSVRLGSSRRSHRYRSSVFPVRATDWGLRDRLVQLHISAASSVAHQESCLLLISEATCQSSATPLQGLSTRVGIVFVPG